MLDFFSACGQLGPCPAVNNRDISAQAFRASRRIHCHIPATNNSYTLPALYRRIAVFLCCVHQIDSRQELVRGVNSNSALSGNAHEFGQSGACAKKDRFIALLQENFRKERRVGWYAQQLNITAKYLSEVVKSVSKRTPNEWIDSYVVLEIRVLLKNSPKTIKEITDELNFPNQSFLGKFFKEHVGLSPSEYRKEG